MKSGPYTEAFKDHIIRLYFEQKQTIRSLSEELGVSESTISRWIAIYRYKNEFNKRIVKEDNSGQEKTARDYEVVEDKPVDNEERYIGKCTKGLSDEWTDSRI